MMGSFLLCRRLSYGRRLAFPFPYHDHDTTPTNRPDAQVATESLGDMEVLDALIAREKYYARIGDKAAALKAADDVSRHLVVWVSWDGGVA